MPRPGGQGARLFFAGHEESRDQRLAFILAIPEFDRSAAGRELDSTLTVIEEGGGRFFSTAIDAGCVTDISAIDRPGPGAERLVVRGAVDHAKPRLVAKAHQIGNARVRRRCRQKQRGSSEGRIALPKVDRRRRASREEQASVVERHQLRRLRSLRAGTEIAIAEGSL